MDTPGFTWHWLPAVRVVLKHPMIADELSTEEWFDLNKAFECILDIREWSDYINRPHKLDTPLTPELKELLIKLAGPNSHFFLKVYRAQRGLMEDV